VFITHDNAWSDKVKQLMKTGMQSVRPGNTSSSVHIHCFISSLPTYCKSHTEWHTFGPPVLKKNTFLGILFYNYVNHLFLYNYPQRRYFTWHNEPWCM